MWVTANLNFDRYRQGKVYEVDDSRANEALLGAGYFTVTQGGVPYEEVTDGPDQAGQGEEDSGGTGSGSASGDPYGAADSDGGQEAGAQG